MFPIHSCKIFHLKFLILVIFVPVLLLMVSLPSSTYALSYHSTPYYQLPKDYNKAIPPKSKNGSPVEVHFKIYVVTVAPIASAEMEFRINMRMNIWWVDPRLNWSNILKASEESCDSSVILEHDISKNIWLPDPYITNAKNSVIKQFGLHELGMLRVVNEEVLWWTMIANVTVSCSMDFRFYPWDIQHCPLNIQSFAYDSSLVDFKWDESNPLDVTPVQLIQFKVVKPPPPDKRLAYSQQQGRNVTQLVAKFRFDRLLGSHLVQSFVPLTLVVALSWFSFWLELDVTAARGSLLMTSMLTLVTHLGSLRVEFPLVAYVKAVDIWIFGCLLSIFFALAEFVLVKVIYSVTEETRRENQVYFLKSQRPPFRKSDVFLRVSKDGRGHLQEEEDEQLEEWSKIWLWDEVGGDLQGRRLPHPIGYQKKRLGSVVLSGRSTATVALPLVTKQLWWGWSLPLVWEREGGQRLVLWRELDNWSKYLFPLTFTFFCILYWTVLVCHSYIVN